MSDKDIKNKQPEPLLEGDDISHLTPEQKQERIWRGKMAVLEFLRDKRRALIDANPASIKMKH